MFFPQEPTSRMAGQFFYSSGAEIPGKHGCRCKCDGAEGDAAGLQILAFSAS